MSHQAARACFDENLRLFINANKDPEKYNLYVGLRSLADAIAKLERDLQHLQSLVSSLKR